VDWRLMKGLGHNFSEEELVLIGRWLKVTAPPVI
jgi:hypothetical protein